MGRRGNYTLAYTLAKMTGDDDAYMHTYIITVLKIQ
jgi:hypothetical protein